MYRAGRIGQSSESVAFTYASPTGVSGVLFWHMPGQDAKEAYQIPLNLPAGNTVQTIVMDMSRIAEWSPKLDSFGFVMNPGEQLLLQRIEFSGPGLIDRIVYPLQSFFVFDEMHSYSINFLWGPMMVYSKDLVPKIFTEIPPYGDSWNAVFYGLILLFVLAAWILRKKRLVAVVVISIWLLLDMRMSAEILSYAANDVSNWWSKPIQERTYRDRGGFTVFAQLLADTVQKDESYVLAASQAWPFVGTLRYETYPALPTFFTNDLDAADLSDKRLWAVYRRNDFAVNEEGQLTRNGEPLTEPGTVLLQYEAHSFLFRIDS